jgi:hypothetical protein
VLVLVRLVLAAVAAVVVASPATADASRILFNCELRLCAMRGDGTPLPRLGPSRLDVDLSDDGRAMTYASGGSVFGADGRDRNRRRLTRSWNTVQWPRYLSFRPRSREIMYFDPPLHGPMRLCRMTLPNGAGRRCGPDQLPWGELAYFAWGPGGSFVAATFPGPEVLCVTTVEARCRRRLTTIGPASFFLSPELSPDGRTFAVTVDHGGSRQDQRITLFDARTGRHLRDLTRGHGDLKPDWSPDGRSIVFQRDAVSVQHHTISSICIVRVRDATTRCPVKDGRDLDYPTWGG